VRHLSGRDAYKRDLFVPFNKIRKMDEVVTEFGMEKLMTMPKGGWREFHRLRIGVRLPAAFSAGVQAAIRRYAWKLIEIGTVVPYWNWSTTGLGFNYK
jgi:hypothetical protein